MKIIQEDKSEIEIETVDSITGECQDFLTISIINRMCNDSAHINLDYREVRQLRDRLDEWLED